MERHVLRWLREARTMSRVDGIALGLLSAISLGVCVKAIAEGPANLLAWLAAAVLVPIGLQGLDIALVAVRGGVKKG